MNNAFNLPDPSSWYCEVMELGRGHRPLVIKLSNKDIKDNAKELHFIHVNYFSGWTSWKGADFRVGTKGEYANVIRQATRKYDQISDQELLNTYPFHYNSLFICGDPRRRFNSYFS